MIFYRLTGLEESQTIKLHHGLNKVGRNPTNDCVIHDGSISGFHAELTVADNGIFLRDLGSTNGTFLDDKPITESQVFPGQAIQFGSKAYRLESEDIQITIPKLPGPEVPIVQPTLEDGSLACLIDPALQATHRCPKCEYAFHATCLRIMKLSGSSSVLLFCPKCNAKVEAIPGIKLKRGKKAGLLDRISETIRLGFKKQ
jgi:hypothetical protein